MICSKLLQDDSRLVFISSNQQEGNDPLDIGLNALDTVEKSKGGRGVKSELSLSAFARRLGKGLTVVSQNAQAAKVYKKVSTQVEGFNATDRAKHLTEIHSAPESTWVILAGLLQAHSWSVKDTKSAVDRVRSVADLAPDWLLDVSSVYPKVAIEPGYAKSTVAALQEGVQHSRRKQIYEALHPEAKRGALGGKGINADILTENISVRTDSYATDAAAATNETERTIRNKTRIGNVLGEFADLLEGTAIANY